MDDKKQSPDRRQPARMVDDTQNLSAIAREEDLLFGTLAVRVGFISESALDAARKQAAAESQRLPDVLVASGALSNEERRVINALIDSHLPWNGGESQESASSPVISPTLSMAQSVYEDTVAMHADEDHPATSAGRFGDYELLGEIAKGGMGVVYKARQQKLGRLVALKMIRSGELADDEQIKRFYTEAEAAAKLDHPNIVPVYEVGDTGGQHFYSMAFVEGKSLHDRVNEEGPLPPTEAATLTRAVAKAVQFAHDKGIVHRDIKPHNVLVDKSGNPRVTDFGLAKQLHSDSDLTATGQVMGTPSYMPPEQAAGQLDRIGPLSDV